MQARYASDRQWYRARIVGREEDLYRIKWALDSWPHFRAGIGGIGSEDPGEKEETGHAAQLELLHLLARGPKISAEKDKFKTKARNFSKKGEEITDLVKDSADLRWDTGEGADTWKAKGKQLWERIGGGGATGMALKMTAALTVGSQARRRKAQSG